MSKKPSEIFGVPSPAVKEALGIGEMSPIPTYVSAEKNPRWAWKDGYLKALKDMEWEMDMLASENPTRSYEHLFKLAVKVLRGVMQKRHGDSN